MSEPQSSDSLAPAPTIEPLAPMQPSFQPAPGSSPMPQQVQQFSPPAPALPAANAFASGSSPLPPIITTQQQVPIFPPGVKVPQNNVIEPAPGLSGQRLATPSPLVNQQQSFGGPITQPLRVATGNAATAFPGSLSDLVASFENVKQKGIILSH